MAEDLQKIGWRDGLRAVWCILKYNLLRSGAAWATPRRSGAEGGAAIRRWCADPS